jgi:hypothetical protein
MHEPKNVIEHVSRWVQSVVVGLNLCPFAADPLSRGKVRVVASRGADTSELLAELLHEIDLLETTGEAETTLIAIPDLLGEFDDFLDAVAAAEALMAQRGLEGRYQLAHFHPHYCFEGVAEDDPANLTNRSPYPLIHIIRWSDVRHAMETYPDVDQIPANNQARLRELGIVGVHGLDLPLALAPFRCWDRHTQAIFEDRGEALDDCILQTRAELEELAEFIRDREIRSYLEIGIWTGRLVTALHHVFRFDTLAAADQGWAEQCGFEISLPASADVFRGDSDSDEFRTWREAQGPIDLVMIDGDHRYTGVRRDFEINRAFPHRFLAFHDITGANRWTTGVRRLWEELDGMKREIIHPHTEAGIDAPTMGIGIWSETEDPR